jgi:hypothetical protein
MYGTGSAPSTAGALRRRHPALRPDHRPRPGRRRTGLRHQLVGHPAPDAGVPAGAAHPSRGAPGARVEYGRVPARARQTSTARRRPPSPCSPRGSTPSAPHERPRHRGRPRCGRHQHHRESGVVAPFGDAGAATRKTRTTTPERAARDICDGMERNAYGPRRPGRVDHGPVKVSLTKHRSAPVGLVAV